MSIRTTAAALAATTLLAGYVLPSGRAYAANEAPPAQSAHQTAIDKDFLKLSKDGAEAFRDLHLARVAIYEAQPKMAADLVKKSETALGRAKGDRTAFMKAEGDLKTPPSAATPATPAAPAKTPSAQPVAWLPVDGQLTLAEDFVATPEKAKAVAEANKDLGKGDQKTAVEKLKLAGVGVGFTMAVLPLEQTTIHVDAAGKLIEQGKYYEANAALKAAEDGLRFDVVDVTGMPQKGATGTSASAAPAAASPATGTTPATGAQSSTTDAAKPKP